MENEVFHQVFTFVIGRKYFDSTAIHRQVYLAMKPQFIVHVEQG